METAGVYSSGSWADGFCGNNPVSNGDPSGLDDADGGNFSAGGSGDYGGITTGNSGGSGLGSSGVTISLGSDDPGLPGFSNLSGSFSGGFSDIGIPTESQNNVSLPHVSSTGLDDWNASVNHLAFTPILGTPASPASGAASVAPRASSATVDTKGPQATFKHLEWNQAGYNNLTEIASGSKLGKAVGVASWWWAFRVPAQTIAKTGISAYLAGVYTFSLLSPQSWNLVPDAPGTQYDSGAGLHQDAWNDPYTPTNITLPTIPQVDLQNGP